MQLTSSYHDTVMSCYSVYSTHCLLEYSNIPHYSLFRSDTGIINTFQKVFVIFLIYVAMIFTSHPYRLPVVDRMTIAG